MIATFFMRHRVTPVVSNIIYKSKQTKSAVNPINEKSFFVKKSEIIPWEELIQPTLQQTDFNVHQTSVKKLLMSFVVKPFSTKLIDLIENHNHVVY